MAIGRRSKFQLVLTALCTALGTALLMSYLLVDKTTRDMRVSDGAVHLASVHDSPATWSPKERTLQPLMFERCRKAERIWPEVGGCDGKPSQFFSFTNCAMRIVKSEGYSLPKQVLDGVQFLLMFVGMSRSGSSIVGSIIDAHPNAVVAHEYTLMDGFIVKPAQHSTKAQIFSRLVGFSLRQAMEKESNFGKGYSLTVKNGTTHIDESTKLTAIGDKEAGLFTALYVTDPDKFTEEYNKLKAIVGVPIKLVQVIRNPFDNIATEAIYQIGMSPLRLALVKGERPPLEPSELGQSLECASTRFCTTMFAISEMETALNQDILRVHLVDLVTKPQRILEEICGFLHLECNEEYINRCEASLFSKLSQTRHLVQWHPAQKAYVEECTARVPWLQRYSFSKD